MYRYRCPKCKTIYYSPEKLNWEVHCCVVDSRHYRCPRIKSYKEMVLEKYPKAVCVRFDLTKGTMYRIIDFTRKLHRISKLCKSEKSAWRSAYRWMERGEK